MRVREDMQAPRLDAAQDRLRRLVGLHGISSDPIELRTNARDHFGRPDFIVTKACGPVAVAVLDPGFNHARTNHRYADVGADDRQFRRQAFRQANDRMFGGGVGAHEGRRRQPRHGGEIDHMAPAASQHVRQHRLDAMDHAHDVDIHHPAPIMRMAVPCGPQHAADPGVVDQ
ncbi:hypothetical protein D3C87_1513460 [compost metagenome]